MARKLSPSNASGWRDNTEIPKPPAIVLIASLLPRSSLTLTETLCHRNSFLHSFRVPEPDSRIINGSQQRRFTGMFFSEQDERRVLAQIQGFPQMGGYYIEVGRRLAQNVEVVLIVRQSFQYMLVVRDLRRAYLS